MKLYLLYDGQYNGSVDNGYVYGIFSSEEIAEKHKRDDDWQITEFDLDVAKELQIV